MRRTIMPEHKGYKIEVEGSAGDYSAFCPDLPGVASCGETREELLSNMREAIDLHLEGIAEDELEESRHATA